MDENKGTSFLVGLLVGSVIGAAIAVLLAPTSGEETRKIIREKAYEPTKSKVVDLVGDARVKANELAEEVKSKAGDVAKDLKDRAGDIWEKGRKVVTDKREELLEAFAKKEEKRS